MTTPPFLIVLDLTATETYPVLTNALRDYAQDNADTPSADTARALLAEIQRQSDEWPGETGA